ncbi:MAG: M24 family metallopeptidase [Alphaproteobacteria bacterium]
MNKLIKLREKLEEHNLDGIIIPMSDPFQNDFIPEYYHRIKFLSGFTGSLGTIIVLKNKAALFVDGRYTLQAQKQINHSLFEIKNYGLPSMVDWLLENKDKDIDLNLGYDAWDYTGAQISQLQKATNLIILTPLKHNLIDEIWKDHPPITKTKIFLYPEKYAGLSWIEKLEWVTDEIKRHQLDGFFLTSSASICWLLNIRGNDVPYTPISLCYALIHESGKIDLFTYFENLTPKIKKHFASRVTFHRMSGVNLEAILPSLTAGLKIGYTKHSSPIKIKHILESSVSFLKNTDDPCVLLRACKTPTEIQHAHKAHLWDGIALAKFFYWIEQTVPVQSINEFDAALKVDALRAENKNFKGPSFPTIAGANQNGSIVHYRPNKRSQTLKQNDLFLCDSGGQYFEGTTDVTRTVCIHGTPTTKQKDLFTRVLKGFISLFLIRFPEGTTGAQLDVLARRALWEVGVDYAHSTGHGVGQYLNVHEGPQSISPRPIPVALRPGMVLSNEPGCYLTGEFGIRIENMMVVEQSSHKDILGKTMLQFRSLTLCPIDRRCIDLDLLSYAEINWLNDYHQQVWEALHKFLPAPEKEWLKKSTAPLHKEHQTTDHHDSIRDSITG